MTIPPLLNPGDVVALVSPASAVDPALIQGACDALLAEGFTPMVMPHAAGRSGSFSGTAAQRLADMQAAIDNPAVKAILCTRGGYGAVHLLGELRMHRPVWIIGFSDISALHAACLHRGWLSIHSSMAKELTLGRCCGNDANRRLFSILRTGHMPAIEFAPHALNRQGEACGILVGGNLAVINGLASTPFDVMNTPDPILVIEDVAEPIYKVERVLWRLRLSGALGRLRGLVVGQFTEYKPSADHSDMYYMIASALADLRIPVAFNAQIGHVDGNLPFVSGMRARLTVSSTSSKIEEII